MLKAKIATKQDIGVVMPPPMPKMYQLYDDSNPITATGIDGNPVQIMNSIGYFTAEQLTAQIADLQAKLDSINAMAEVAQTEGAIKA